MDPDVTGAKDTANALDLDVALADVDGSETITDITLCGVPDGAMISAGTDNGDGTWALTPDDLDGLTITRPLNSNNDFALTVSAMSIENDGDVATTVASFDVEVVAVADDSTLTVQDETGLKDTWIQLNLVAVLTDIHGFEEITRIIISEVPEGVFLSPGTDNGDGTWSVSLGELPLVCILPPEDFGDDIKMTVSITSREDNAGDAAASQDFTITVLGVADAPEVAVERVTGDEDTAIGSTETVGGDAATTVANLAVTVNEVASVPVASAPVASAPVAPAPVAPAPVAPAPIAPAPIASAPIASAPVASAPIASVVDAEELEDNTIALVIDAEFPDPNANQTITISGMPEGATLSVGTDNHDGSWTLAPEQLEKLTITPPADSNQNFTLMVTATATETSTGATAETAATINVSVTGFTDPPTVGTALGDPLSSFANTVDRIGPVGHWRFEESSGTDADNDVIYHNGVTLGAEGIDGDGSAASFDGYNNFVEIPYFDDLPLDRGSVQLWFNTPDVNSRQGLFSKNSNDDGTLAIWIENGEINVRLRSDDSSHNIRSNFDLSVEEWRQVTLNFGPDEMELYVDGTLAGTSDHAGGLGTPSGGSGNSKSVIIGAIAEATGDGVANNLKNFFQGRIDEVVIYDRPLSAGQVASLYNVGTRGGDILIFPLDVTASLTDADDSNTLSVTVSGLPKGATLSAGTDNGDGLWALTPAQLNGLMVSIGPDVTDDLNLSATARATENDGDFAETVTVTRTSHEAFLRRWI